jgi:hypothetical protein
MHKSGISVLMELNQMIRKKMEDNIVVQSRIDSVTNHKHHSDAKHGDAAKKEEDDAPQWMMRIRRSTKSNSKRVGGGPP